MGGLTPTDLCGLLRGGGQAALLGELSETLVVRRVLLGISLHTPSFGILQGGCRKHSVCALCGGSPGCDFEPLRVGWRLALRLCTSSGGPGVSVGNSQAPLRNTALRHYRSPLRQPWAKFSTFTASSARDDDPAPVQRGKGVGKWYFLSDE
jgi:hypothetical protein